MKKAIVILACLLLAACNLPQIEPLKLDGQKLFDEINNTGNHDG